MDIKTLFDYVLENYKNCSFGKNDKCYNIICNELPKLINASVFTMRNEIVVDGSCGKGQKTDYPWIAVFNKKITRTATKGIYIVYLFKSDMSGFYMTLNQGITYFDKQFRKDKYNAAMKVVDYFRSEIKDISFSKSNISLGQGRGNLGKGYERTTIISKYYQKGNYTEDELIIDLKKMMEIYDSIVGVLGEVNYDYEKAVDRVLLIENDVFTPVLDAIDEINKKISSVTDVDIVRKLKYEEPKVRNSKEFSRIRNPEGIRKIDYIDKAKSDAEIGELGEKLALEYEYDRLVNLGRKDLADQIKRVSLKSDAFGYDIESFDLIGEEYKKIYIEVKTTANKADVEFQVSRNEVEASNELDKDYCVFRIYDVKNANPKFYKVYGKLKDNFELNPITYMARYKPNNVRV
ncbi:MAG: DUF3578 domain-containing protein [Bacilli bacterium]